MEGSSMANKWKGSIRLEDINEELVLIEESYTDYITPLGNIYKLMDNGLYIKKACGPNPHNGYVYIGVTLKDGGHRSMRVHRLVARAFISNPNNHPIVGHKDNNKANNHVDNLYWTTVQENTQKAFDDGLAKNAKGYDDSQSKAVIVYDLNMNELYRFGSIRECSRELGVSKSSICGQCNGKMKTKPRCGYYFRFDEEINNQN